MRALVLCALLVLAAPVAAQPPLVGRVIAVQVEGGGMILTVALGAEAGLDHSWTATLVSNDRPLGLPALPIIRIDKRTTRVKLAVTFDQIPPNLRVRFTPPAPPPPPPAPPIGPPTKPSAPIDI